MTPSPMNLQRTAVVRVVATILALSGLLMTGCAPITYRAAFNDYSEVYADSQNHQMLLNLARLSQHSPPYFFQSGNIQANYTFSGSFVAQAQQSQGADHVKPYGWLWNELGFQGTRTTQPTFNFVPLVGGDFAAHLITPIRPDVFYAFFQAGYPVDILLRSLVQQVHFTAGANSIFLNNTPTVDNITNYARFLCLCGMLRDLQDRGYLLLVPPQNDTNSQEFSAEFTNAIDPKVIFSSLSEGYHWTEQTSGVWRVDRQMQKTNTLSFQFQLTQEGITYLKGMTSATNPPLAYLHKDQVGHLLASLSPDSKIPPAKVTLRSFLFTLEDMATEQAAFEELMTNESFMTNNVPTQQLRPVLRIVWNNVTEPTFEPLITVNYQNMRYAITDPKQEWPDGYNSYNRDAFMLACTLISQISLDPTTLNYQQQYLLTR